MKERRTGKQVEDLRDSMIHKLALGKTPYEIQQELNLTFKNYHWHLNKIIPDIAKHVRENRQDNIDFWINQSILGLQNLLKPTMEIVNDVKHPQRVAAIGMAKDILVDIPRIYRDGPKINYEPIENRPADIQTREQGTPLIRG